MATSSCPDQSLVQQVRYWSYIQEQLGLFVCEDPNSSTVKNGSYCFAAVSILIAGLDCWFIKKALEKEKKIVRPQGMPFNETYCTLSLKLLRIAKYGLYFQVIMQLYVAVLSLVSPEVYNTLMYGQKSALQRLCSPDDGFVGVWLIHWLMSCVTSIFMDLIILYQTLEWQVMLDLISFQKDRTPDQIVDDHNQCSTSTRATSQLTFLRLESIGKSIKKESLQNTDEDDDTMTSKSTDKAQVTFKRREARAKVFHFIFQFLIILFLAVIFPVAFVNTGPTIHLSLISERCLLQFWCTCVFFRLYYSMMKMHKFEFSRNKKLLKSQFAAIALLQLARVIYIADSMYGLEEQKEEACQDPTQAEYNLWVEGGFRHPISQVVMILIYIYNLPILLLTMTLIYLKSSQDILQGISKLDYLLKVSVFQVYKDKSLQPENHRDLTMGPASTFIRVSSSINNPSEHVIIAQYSSSVLDPISEDDNY